MTVLPTAIWEPLFIRGFNKSAQGGGEVASHLKVLVCPHVAASRGGERCRQSVECDALNLVSERDCHCADTPSPSILKHLLKGEGCAAK